MSTLRIHRPWPRLASLFAALVLLGGFLTATTAPASAAPVTEGSPYTAVTFSNDTVAPGSSFTVRVDYDLHRTTVSGGLIGAFSLGGSQWTYDGCQVVSGNLTGCEYLTGSGYNDSWDHFPNQLDIAGSALYTFTVDSGASGAIPYSGSPFADSAGTTFTSYSGALTIGSPEADLGVSVTATPQSGLLVPALTFSVTATNNGPDPATGATIAATIPSGVTATNLSSGCSQSGTTVSCTYGAIADGANATKSFRLPIGLLTIGQVTVTATRTSSTPDDPNATNDTGSHSCTVVSIILATC